MKRFIKIKEKVESGIGEHSSITVVPKRIPHYNKKIETAQYAIYEPCRGENRVVAAYGDMMIIQNYRNPNKLTLYPYYSTKLIHYSIFLNKKTFPGLIEGSSVLKCLLLPYLRVVGQDKFLKAIRLVVITDKAQIYHNFPARSTECEGFSQPGDIVQFEESVIWDIPGRKYPVNTPYISETEHYYPNLPNECYMYHPIPNDDPHYKDLYGNGGFARKTTVKQNDQNVAVSRFYIHKRTAAANPFHFIGNGEAEYKMSLIATYRSNVEEGVRTCLFASTDGGRQWYCKYEFADFGDYDFAQGHGGRYGRNFGNSIRNADYSVSGRSITVKKRSLVVPSSTQKEPEGKFRWSSCGTVKTVSGAEKMIIHTWKPHELSTGNIVVLCGCEGLSDDMKWMLNNDVSENSAGNGILFKVEVIDEESFYLYECVSSPDNNIPCRHIHHVNRIKDGWLIGTGEIYPNGWVLYFQMKQADTFTPAHASDEFQILRLNSTEMSVQRTMGAQISDEPVPRLLYASDHDLLEREEKKIVEDRMVGYSHNSTGVFECSLHAIDDRVGHRMVFDASEPCFYFQRLASAFIFCGQRGEIGISNDGGMTWSRERIKEPIIHYYGCNGQRYYFDSCVIIRK